MHASAEQLVAGLADVRLAPATAGTLELIVARPSAGERTVLAAGELSELEGLVGDSWRARGSRRHR